jgi:hypothetical protein
LAEKTTAIIMTAVESRYFLRINGHPQVKLFRGYCDGIFGSIGRLLCGLQIRIEVQQSRDGYNSPNCSNPIEDVGRSKLTFSITLLGGILVVILGGRINYNAIDRWGTLPAMIGWLLIVGGGLMVLFLLVPMAAQLLKL